MRNLIISAALVAASLFGMSAQAATPIEAGKQYVELTPAVLPTDKTKIEVVEVFWYGCPHCYAFEPTINPWVEKLPSDVKFVRIPAMFGGPWDAHGQLFITLDTMGVEQKVHAAVFEAIQKGGKRLTDKNDMADFLATQGIDKTKFLETFDSFAVKGKINTYKELAKKYQVTGVPTMIVNGKYRFDLGTAGGPEKTLEVADQLIAKERAATTAAK
ncbi:thiol:disulfide interchange protein DsbA/DsbL [Pseudomonas syringae]|uniref:thiol:disulfide interchange protein DsbA/DsbL n=1 Tax=Pseudomonas syringae TaxID=317 RepID=UPI003F74F05A